MSTDETKSPTPGVGIMWCAVFLFITLLIWDNLGSPPRFAYLIVGIMLMGGAMVAQTEIGKRS